MDDRHTQMHIYRQVDESVVEVDSQPYSLPTCCMVICTGNWLDKNHSNEKCEVRVEDSVQIWD